MDIMEAGHQGGGTEKASGRRHHGGDIIREAS